MAYAASLPDRPSEAVELISRLQQRLALLEQNLEGVQQENASLRRQLQAARTGSGSPASGGLPGPGMLGGTPGTYTVRGGDTLMRIAAKVYNDSGQWERIFNANRSVLRRPEDLRQGQVLTIPQGQQETE
jgi:nucleoid-associated protein YgaU